LLLNFAINNAVLLEEQAVLQGELKRSLPTLYIKGLSLNKRLAVIFILTSLISLLTVTVGPTKASSQTIIVPDDYPTITDAIGNCTKEDTIFVKSGIYAEQTLVINKTLTLIGENAEDTIINNIDSHAMVEWLGGYRMPFGITTAVDVKANDVKISGFTITNASTGITTEGNETKIVANIIEGLDTDGGYDIGISASGKGTQIIDNIINAANVGIFDSGSYQVIMQNIFNSTSCTVGPYGQYNIIADNILYGSRAGINLQGNLNVAYNNTVVDGDIGIEITGVSNIIYKNVLNQNNLGIEIGPWAINDFLSNNIVCANTITDNQRYGIIIASGRNNTVYANHIADNKEIGGMIAWNQSSGILYNESDRERWQGRNADNNTFYNNNFVNNSASEATDWSWQGTNSWDNGKEGNYWSDYNGTDANGDGIGDVSYPVNKPYRILISSFPEAQLQDPTVVNPNNVSDRYPLMEPFDTESITIELPEWATVTPHQIPSFSPSPSPPPTQPPSPSPTPKTTQTPNPTPTSTSAQTPSPPLTEQPSPSNSVPPTSNNSSRSTDAYWTAAAAVVAVTIVIIAATLMLRKQHNSK
jgi:parallel beta-helix repeat protein